MTDYDDLLDKTSLVDNTGDYIVSRLMLMDAIRALREQVAAKDAEIVRLGNDCERERVRLAACGVVALANTRESAAQVRPPYDNDDYAYSASLDDVAGAVDEQIEQRERAERAEAENAALRQQNINLDKATDELYRRLDAKEADNAALRAGAGAAFATLKFLGYTYHGGEQWKPPLGERPDAALLAGKKP